MDLKKTKELEEMQKSQKMEVEQLLYNWHQVGGANDAHGMDEYYHSYKVGEKGVVRITEHQDEKGVMNYLVIQHVGESTVQQYRVFNPNHVTYKPKVN